MEVRVLSSVPKTVYGDVVKLVITSAFQVGIKGSIPFFPTKCGLITRWYLEIAFQAINKEFDSPCPLQ